jgi:hypothetical protein
LAACSLEMAELFFVAADLGGDRFEAAADLVDLDGEARQGGGVPATGAVFVYDGVQVVTPVEGGPADLRAGGYFLEGDWLPGGSELGACGLDPGELPGPARLSWHRPG